MATIILGAVGTAIGGGFGGAVLGLSGATIGGMIGSAAGSMVDSWIVSSLAPGQRIEGARMDSLRMVSATEGVVIPRLYGRMRLGGNIIWATDFREETNTTRQGGGKGGGPKVTTTEYLYYASFAVGLCEGAITGIGRVWADGEVLDISEVTWRWYPGDETQAPDPFISAKMGAGNTPAYRGTAYVVFEELPLARFGNRLPQLSFEVFRPLDDADTAEGLVPAVTIIPASGEFSYATGIVRKTKGGNSAAENVNAMAETADMLVSLDRLEAMVPSVESASLVVTWFGDDLRAGMCTIRPKVEMAEKITTPTWSVNGVTRAQALVVSQDDRGRPVYGGTPADFSVIEAIREMKARGLRVTLYPFLMMDVPAGNALPDPYSDNAASIGQPVLPWRGRITCAPAAGFAGTVDRTVAATGQVAAFFGNATPADFSVSGEAVTWTGPAGDWGFRRMILHYAHLCAVAGGVDAFLIGSEMRGLSQIRSGAATYPAVQQFRDLAAAVRAILGPETKISYAADWSEYFGHQPQDGSGDVFFHLDPLWTDAHVDFVGIDNYMPLSDWRDGWDHEDALRWPSIYDRNYLQANIAGGEGFDWFYASAADRISQTRTPIEDSITPGPAREVISAMPASAPSISRAPGASFTATVPQRSASITMSCRVQFPALIADGIVFEIGNLTTGMFFGLAGGQLILHEIFSAIGQIRTASIPAAALAGRTVDLVAWFDMATGEIGFAVDGNVVATASFGGAVSGVWAGNNACGYGIANGPVPGSSTVTTALPWPATLVTDLSIWSGAAPSFTTLPAVVPEPWIFRYKDIRAWWSNQHRNRPGGVPTASPTAWLPQSKPIRFTELGCPAVDRGTNQPNVFHDPKSSESFVPYFSRGWRDDAIQRAYLEATYLWWSEAANNPISSVYGGHMVDVTECAAWTWDARPYPFFPELSEIWSDGANWRLGHWLTGRLGAVSLAALVRQLCLRAGLPEAWIDVSGLTGAVDGYVISALESPRTSITMLARHFGFDAVESEGRIRFTMRGRAPVATISPEDMVAGQAEVMELTRGQETELPQALKWQVVRADEDYDGITVESRRITVEASRVSSDSFPMAVPPEEADRRCRRALMEAWIGRETGSFRLPPSMLALDPADVILLDHDGRQAEMRILSLSDAEARGVETIRQDRAAYDLPPGSPRPAALAQPVVFGAPLVEIMNLPQLREDHVPHHPLIAAHARPWPGQMAVFRSPDQDGFELATVFTGRARMGVLAADLHAGPTARFDLGNSVHVDLLTGTLESVTDLRLFGGDNSLAVAQPTGRWEVLQFGDAELLAPGRYRLSRLLRGQRGTDADMAPMAPTGARVVLLDAALAPLPVTEADLGLPWNWRVGPASRPVSDASFTARAFTPMAMGLRPFSPVHVEQPWRRGRVPGDLTIRWTRRDRSLAADSWNAAEIPMTEASEAWHVEILDGATVKRVLTVATTAAVYTAAQQVADWGGPLGPGASLDLRIAQIGQAYGAGSAPITTLWF